MNTKRVLAMTFMAVVAAIVPAVVLAVPKVTGIDARYRNGQTFITWNNGPETGVRYTVYRWTNAILDADDLDSATKLGWVGDNSSTNPRAFAPGGPATYRLKADIAPLDAGRGLFVATTAAGGSYYYAVTVTVGAVEYTAFETGKNTLGAPVAEVVADPQPVLQTSYIEPVRGNTVSVYTQFLTGLSSATYPVMTNAGSYPVCFAITEPPVIDTDSTKKHPLIVRMHNGPGNYLDHVDTKLPFNTWQLSLDDHLPNTDYRTAWFGYHEDYDITDDNNPVPATCTVVGYTTKRVIHTLDWTQAHFNIADSMVYLDGNSMGAAGALITLMLHPDRFAAAQLVVPKMNFAELDDWQDTLYDFWDNGPKRLETNKRWGLVATNLPTDVFADGDELHIFDLSNAGFMAGFNVDRSLPIIFAVNGKNDDVVGWTEKLPYYYAINESRHGGFYFWDQRDHSGGTKTWSNWEPDFLRYNTKLSYAAFSNCSITEDSGTGNAASGDPYGTVNGFLDWVDGSIVDKVDEWRITLNYRVGLKWLLGAGGGSVEATPEADVCTADVTLRRLQKFSPEPGDVIRWRNKVDGVMVQEDSFTYSGGLITIPGVEIHKTGNQLRVWIAPGLGGGEEDPEIE